MAMQKLRERMTQFKDKIDETEEREYTAKQELKEAEAKVEQNEIEADGIRRRITLLKRELEKNIDRLDEVTDRLDRANNKTQNEEKARKEMEECEMEGDEKLQYFDDAVKEAQLKEEESARTLVEAKRRYQKVEDDYTRESLRYEKLHSKITESEDIIRSANESMSELERCDEEASEREELSEEKAVFLTGQLKETITRAEEAERRIGQLERQVDTVNVEIDMWVMKKTGVIEEMESLTEIADDI